MEPETLPTPPTETQPKEKLPWSAPELKKLNIEETAISIGQNFDGDGFS